MTTTFSSESSIAVGLHLILNSLTEGADRSMVSRWLSEYDKRQRQKKRATAVFAAVAEGYDTIEEIASHTEIPESSVRRILARFVEMRRVRQIKSKNPRNRIELRFEVV